MKIDILSHFVEALEQEELAKCIETGLAPFTAYRNLIKLQNKTLIDLHKDEEDYVPGKEDLDFLLDELAEIYELRRKKYESEKRKEKQRENRKQKEDIIEALRKLISEEENIGKAFNTFNNLQDQWGKTGEVPSDDFHRIQSEYSRLRESFYYNIKIYKELADHDKKRNEELKKAIIEEVKALTKEKSINVQNSRVRELIKKWDSIGMTYEESWNTLREEFWTNTRSILNRIDHHYNDLREKSKKSLEAKEKLIEDTKKIIEFDHKTNAHWKKSTEKILAIQQKWKTIGPSEKNEAIWKQFRKTCDVFFNAKNEYYGELTKSNKQVEEKKRDLIRQSSILKDSDDWKESTKAIIRLQDDWKKAGSANPKKENLLWKEFRTNLDYFFNKKSKFFAGKDDREKENLIKKEAILKQINDYKLTGNVGTDIAAFKAFASEWKDIGFVPYKKKDTIFNAYKKAMDEKYDSLKLDKAERVKVQFQNKIDGLKSQRDPEKAFDFERRRIRKQIDELQSSILQRENNLGFFTMSKGGSGSLLDTATKQIKRDKNRIEELKLMLRQLRDN